MLTICYGRISSKETNFILHKATWEHLDCIVTLHVFYLYSHYHNPKENFIKSNENFIFIYVGSIYFATFK